MARSLASNLRYVFMCSSEESRRLRLALVSKLISNTYIAYPHLTVASLLLHTNVFAEPHLVSQ